MSLILCYHKVGPESEEGRRLNIEPSRLRSHIRWLKRRGLRLVRGEDYSSGLLPKTACLTFDDGYTSTLTYGVEAMKQEGATGTIYAVSSLIGKESSWDEGGPRPLAPLDLLLKAQGQGIEIGNHTDVHPRLGELDREAQAGHIIRAQSALLGLGLLPGSFCYPYGSLNPSSASALDDARLKVGMALGKRAPRTGDDLRLLPRIVLAFSDGTPGLAYKVLLKPRLYRILGKDR